VDNRNAVILQIALDTPLRRVFDYLRPAALDARVLQPGIRIRVPFGRRQMVGILLGTAPDSVVDPAKLKAALDVLDEAPVFDPVTFDLLRWAADYYHHPIGEVLAAALPVSLRDGQCADDAMETWSLTAAGRREWQSPTDRRAPRQRALLAWLGQRDGDAAAVTADEVHARFKPDLLRALGKRGWAAAARLAPSPARVE